MEQFLYEKQLNFDGEDSEEQSNYEDGPSEQSRIIQMGRDGTFSESNQSCEFGGVAKEGLNPSHLARHIRPEGKKRRKEVDEEEKQFGFGKPIDCFETEF